MPKISKKADLAKDLLLRSSRMAYAHVFLPSFGTRFPHSIIATDLCVCCGGDWGREKLFLPAMLFRGAGDMFPGPGGQAKMKGWDMLSTVAIRALNDILAVYHLVRGWGIAAKTYSVFLPFSAYDALAHAASALALASIAAKRAEDLWESLDDFYDSDALDVLDEREHSDLVS